MTDLNEVFHLGAFVQQKPVKPQLAHKLGNLSAFTLDEFSPAEQEI